MHSTHSATVHLTARWKAAFMWLAAITLLNYVAQIPYYVHFYAIRGVGPSPFGIVLLLATLLLFLAGWGISWQGRRIGSALLVAFLVLEAGFYLLHNISGAFLKDVPINDPLFLIVSLIGYVNTIVPIIFLVAMARDLARFFPPAQGHDSHIS